MAESPWTRHTTLANTVTYEAPGLAAEILLMLVRVGPGRVSKARVRIWRINENGTYRDGFRLPVAYRVFPIPPEQSDPFDAAYHQRLLAIATPEPKQESKKVAR